jgi:predicted transposase/invertase (TIGR01784 family)
MSQYIHHPHDKFFKAMMAERELVIGFLQFFLPEEISRMIDFNRIEAYKDSFVTEELKEIFSDAIFRCPVLESENSSLFVSVLIEHKSYPDKMVAVQLLSYLANAYQTQMKSEEPLHVVVPMIFYHGVENWEYNSLRQLVPGIMEEFKRYIPDFETLFVDLARMSEEALNDIQLVLLRAALQLQRYSVEPELLLEKMRKILERIDSERDIPRNFSRQLFVYFFEISEISVEELTTLIEDLPVKTKSKIMTTYEQIEKRGFEKGIEKGVEKGIFSEKTRLIIQGSRKGLSLELLSDISGLSLEMVQKIIHEHQNQ